VNAVEFGTLFQFIRNGMNVMQDKSGDGLPITRIETISDATVDGARVGFAGLTEAESRDWLLAPGDILFSHINSVEHVGKCAVYRGTPEKLVHGMNLLCLRTDTAKLLPEFAKYMMRGAEFRTRLSNFINKAVNQASVSIGNLKTIPVTVPSLAEQLRIAEVLDRAEALRTKRRAALAQLDSLTQSLFLDLFGDVTTNDRKWPVRAVNEFVAGFESGKSIVGDDEEDAKSAYRVLKVSAVTSLEFRPEQSKAMPPDYRPPPSHIVRTGDLLFSRANTAELIGATAFVSATPPNLLLPDKLWRFVWHDEPKADPHFVRFLFQRPKFRREISQRASGTSGSMKNISQDKVLTIETGLPPLLLQREFARRVTAVEKLKMSHRASLSELDALFATLQHRAFRGEL
jgi:type I restriction enzyme S subunit